MRDQVHTALIRMEDELNKIASVLLAIRLRKGAQLNRTLGHEEPAAGDPGTTRSER